MSLPGEVEAIRFTAGGGLVWPTMFMSKTLGIRCNVFVYTPPGVGRSDAKLARLPVLYLLHGMWGSEIDWPFKGRAAGILDREILAGRVPPMLVAMPHDGLAETGTFYMNWHNGKGKFERYFMGDLLRFVEQELAGRRRSRRERLIAGLSMGGFGALTLSFRHPGRFAAAAAMSGAVRPIDQIGGAASPSRRVFGPLSRDPASHRRRHDPLFLLTGPARVRPAVYFDCGRADFLLAMNRKLHRRLERDGIEHTYVEYDGAHDWLSWRRRLPHVLRFFAGVLRD